MTRAEVQRGRGRFATWLDWLESKHSFSYGPHYDPANTHFGLLLVSNEDVVRAGAGFDMHPHHDAEIVTWVLSGSLVHRDSAGHRGVIHPGLAQRMSAGIGILHSEMNDSWRLDGGPEHDEPVHYVQMWVAPDRVGFDPEYEQLDVSAELARGGWVTVASGRPEHRDQSATRIHQRDAALHVARLAADTGVNIPAAPYVHLFVAAGAVDLEGAGRLDAGDAARVRAADGQRLVAAAPAEVLVWEMHAARTRPRS